MSASAAPPKRVLLIHSFGNALPQSRAVTLAFETQLAEKMGGQVDLDQVSLDMARYADRDSQEAMVDYLQKRQAKWDPDVVVTMAAPAAIFVATYRDRLFPEIPIVYASLDRRLLPPGALEKNAIYIGQEFNIPGWIEDMVQIAPATKNIEVVVGATPLELKWQEAFQKAAEPFAGRIKFTYYNDLPFAQVLERVAKLPPDSYIFLLVFLRDASGVTRTTDEVLQRLHEVANAPINSIFSHQLGQGIVGGRLYQSDRVGKEAADAAIRILNGESAANFPPAQIDALPPHYDWRELHRWKISEKLLPTGSTVLYRAPTAWQQYRTWIISGIALFVAEGVLIAALLANLVKRRRAERSLTESEARFRTVADSAPVLIWVAGPDNLGVFFNKAWLEFTGQTMEHETGNGWAEGIHPADRNGAIEICANAVARREPFVMQFRLRRHDGIYRTVTDEAVPRCDAQGNLLGYIGACVDITDLLEQQRALHESEDRVALAAEAAHLGTWEWDMATNKFWLSDQARNLFQFEPETHVTYSDWNDRVHPEDRTLRDEAYRRAIATQGRYELEYRIRLPDQTERWIAGRGHYVPNPENKHGTLLGVSMDVTQRKQAEQLFQLAAEVSHLGIWDWDETTGKLTFDNAMREIYDVPRDEEITLDAAYRRIYPADLDQVKQVWRQSVESGIPYQHEYRIQKSNGAICWVNARGRGYYDDKGKPLRMIGLVFDITERKQAEEEARKRREEIDLLSRVSLLGEMTASIAHELNQPLSAIISNANAGTRFIDKGNVDLGTIREILVDVAADGHRADEIIHAVRNTMKKGGAVRQPIDLNETVAKVAHLVQPHATAHSCVLKMSLAESLPPIDGDPVQIQQVLVNLITNAFDAMRETPPTRRVVEIQTAQNGDRLICVSVQDCGDGIPDAGRERLFDQFFTTKEEGLGMGLAIVRSIIEAHGGKIGAENVNGGGARFHFTLPQSSKVK
jgi:PAS domain S-box-containing protein